MSQSRAATDVTSKDCLSITHSRRTVFRGLAATGSAAFALKNTSESANATQPSQQGPANGPLSDSESFEAFLDGAMNAQFEAHDTLGDYFPE